MYRVLYQFFRRGFSFVAVRIVVNTTRKGFNSDSIDRRLPTAFFRRLPTGRRRPSENCDYTFSRELFFFPKPYENYFQNPPFSLFKLPILDFELPDPPRLPNQTPLLFISGIISYFCKKFSFYPISRFA